MTVPSREFFPYLLYCKSGFICTVLRVERLPVYLALLSLFPQRMSLRSQWPVWAYTVQTSDFCDGLASEANSRLGSPETLNCAGVQKAREHDVRSMRTMEWVFAIEVSRVRLKLDCTAAAVPTGVSGYGTDVRHVDSDSSPGGSEPFFVMHPVNGRGLHPAARPPLSPRLRHGYYHR
jgi:hypothetical protein